MTGRGPGRHSGSDTSPDTQTLAQCSCGVFTGSLLYLGIKHDYLPQISGSSHIPTYLLPPIYNLSSLLYLPLIIYQAQSINAYVCVPLIGVTLCCYPFASEGSVQIMSSSTILRTVILTRTGLQSNISTMIYVQVFN